MAGSTSSGPAAPPASPPAGGPAAPAALAAGRTAVLLVQLGTPDAPDAGAVRRYLAEFLSDPRVVDLPRAAWLPLLHGVILRTRPAASARKYQRVWTPAGSPLLVHSLAQRDALQARLAASASGPGASPQRAASSTAADASASADASGSADTSASVDTSGRADAPVVELAMRYGNPSLGSVLDALRERMGPQPWRLVVVPMYPQFAASTAASVVDALAAHLRSWRDLPELHVVRAFADDAGYLDALHARVRAHWAAQGRAGHLVMSFHGLPQAQIDHGDPYERECRVTAAALAQRLGLAPHEWTLTFQSRLGRARWLQPYTEPVLCELAGRGVRDIDVVCPGFVADCLETIDEIGHEAAEAFTKAGGASLRLVPCLNADPAFIDALAALVTRAGGR